MRVFRRGKNQFNRKSFDNDGLLPAVNRLTFKAEYSPVNQLTQSVQLHAAAVGSEPDIPVVGSLPASSLYASLAPADRPLIPRLCLRQRCVYFRCLHLCLVCVCQMEKVSLARQVRDLETEVKARCRLQQNTTDQMVRYNQAKNKLAK